MNRTLATAILTATLSATLGVPSLQAQDGETANVPFAFHLKSRTMPAGQYEVKHIGPGSSLVSITNHRGNFQYLITSPEGTANPNEPKLTFACYGNNCALAAIDLPGSDVSYGVDEPNPSYKLGMAAMVAVRITH